MCPPTFPIGPSYNAFSMVTTSLPDIMSPQTHQGFPSPPHALWFPNVSHHRPPETFYVPPSICSDFDRRLKQLQPHKEHKSRLVLKTRTFCKYKSLLTSYGIYDVDNADTY